MPASSVARLTRLLAAAFVVASGVMHLNLWLDGYRGIPHIGPLFLVNFAASVVVGGALFFRGGVRLVLLAVAFSIGSLVALVMSRTVGLLGFSETWTPRALQTLALELGAVLMLVSSLAGERRPGASPMSRSVTWSRRPRALARVDGDQKSGRSETKLTSTRRSRPPDSSLEQAEDARPRGGNLIGLTEWVIIEPSRDSFKHTTSGDFFGSANHPDAKFGKELGKAGSEASKA